MSNRSDLHKAVAEIFLMQEAEVEIDYEGGQPNGLGELEPESYREWFKPERNTHRRRVTTIYGPWEKINE